MVELKKHNIRKQLLTLAGISLASCFFAFPSLAGSVFADDPCDPQYYESLESRAWLEAQREITQNQNLIFKPDSVLEYTCFDSYLSVLVSRAPNMFSESTRWGGSGAGNMSSTLSGLVGSAMNSYDTSNFNHNLLGGRSNAPSSLSGSVSSGSYSCNTMNQVWRLAKCMDFIDQNNYPPLLASSNFDGFFTFSEYVSGPERRFLPSTCTGANQYQANINTATVNGAAPNTPWDEDNIVTYFEYIYPPTNASDVCGDDNQSQISTGLIVERATDDGNGVTRYAEKVCVVPGCYFVPNADYGSANYNTSTIQGGDCCAYNETSCP